MFDRVHASAHKKELPLSKFLVFALDVIRRHAPHLEGGFRHVFMLRNASRRRNMQSGRAAAPCSRPHVDMTSQPLGGGQEGMDDAVDQALKRFSGMCVGEGQAVERKRQCDEPIEDSWHRRRAYFMNNRVH